MTTPYQEKMKRDLNKFLVDRHSPLAPHAHIFVREGVKQGVDPRALVSITGAETSYATNPKAGQDITVRHNPFGLGPHIAFKSWEEAIARAAYVLRTYYLNEGRTTTVEIRNKWAPLGAANDPRGQNEGWAKNVSTILTKLGGDPSAWGPDGDNFGRGDWQVAKFPWLPHEVKKSVGYPLVLTSPLMTGQAVRDLQKALADNPYGDFKPGEIDGEYGPITSQAVYRAKFWLGYKNPDHSAGELLYLFLAKGKELYPELKQRRAERKKAQATKPLRELAWEEAGRWLGTTEKPYGSNQTPFGKWYDWDGVFWCAIFVSYCYGVGAKSKAINPRDAQYAYCPYVERDARAGRNNLTVTRTPKRGDIVLFDWDNDSESDHIGLFGEWLNEEHTIFSTREGNTSAEGSGGSQSNGGGVFERRRYIGDVELFVHVGA